MIPASGRYRTTHGVVVADKKESGGAARFVRPSLLSISIALYYFRVGLIFQPAKASYTRGLAQRRHLSSLNNFIICASWRSWQSWRVGSVLTEAPGSDLRPRCRSLVHSVTRQRTRLPWKSRRICCVCSVGDLHHGLRVIMYRTPPLLGSPASFKQVVTMA